MLISTQRKNRSFERRTISKSQNASLKFSLKLTKENKFSFEIFIFITVCQRILGCKVHLLFTNVLIIIYTKQYRMVTLYKLFMILLDSNAPVFIFNFRIKVIEEINSIGLISLLETLIFYHSSSEYFNVSSLNITRIETCRHSVSIKRDMYIHSYYYFFRP